MRTRLSEILIVAGLVIGAIFVFDKCRGDRNAAWESRAVAALATSEILSARVDSLSLEAETLRSQAATSVDTIVISRAPVTDSIVAALPAAVTVGEQIRDTVIVRLTGERDDALNAYLVLSAGYDKLNLALGLATARADTLESVLRDRPGPRPWYLPEITVGASAGWCTYPVSGPCVAAPAVTIGWKIGL